VNLQIECVLDASAALALIFQERGAGAVDEVLPVAAMSAVNASEVVAKLILCGAPAEQAKSMLAGLQLPVLPFEAADASLAATLITETRKRGLSFGDRACLATAMRLDVPVLTADRHWKGLNVGIDIRIVR
jgi:ribonuclease VapC